MLDLRTGKHFNGSDNGSFNGSLTRRETIKGGLGLAAILAAGKAPAMLLGARGVAFVKESLYRRVSAIVSHGTEWISLGYLPRRNDVVLEFRSSGSYEWGWVYQGKVFETWIDGFSKEGFGERVNYGNYNNVYNITYSSSVHTRKFDFASGFYIDGVKKVSFSIGSSVVSSISVRLPFLARHDKGTNTYTTLGLACNLEAIQIREGSAVVRNFIPVVAKFDGVEEACLYNLNWVPDGSFGRQFYRNEGAGSFGYIP